MKRKLLGIITFLLLSLPLCTFADVVKRKITIGDEDAFEGECLKNICVDENNEIVTMNGSTDLPEYENFENLTLEIKGNVVWDLSDYNEEDDNYIFKTLGDLKIHINDNSTLTIKNSQNLISFVMVDNITIKGEKNSKLVFENSNVGFASYSAPFTIRDVTIESSTPMNQLILISGSEDDTLTLENTVINVDKSKNESSYDYLIRTMNSSIIIKNSTITSKYELQKYEFIDNFNSIISVGKDMDILNSKLDLKNFTFAIEGSKSVRIKESELRIENVGYAIFASDVLFESGILYVSTIEDGISLQSELTSEQWSCGLTAENTIEIRNGYLSFSERIIPLLTNYEGTISSDYSNYLKINSTLKANKEYMLGSISHGEFGILYLAKIGTEKSIIIDGAIPSEMSKHAIQGIVFQGKTKVHFDAGSGDGTMTDQDIDYAGTLPENKFTAPSGKQFKGWSLSKDGEVITKLGNYSEVTLYPVWEDIPKEEKKEEKENPNTGAIIKVALVLGMLSIGVAGIAISNKNKKFN